MPATLAGEWVLSPSAEIRQTAASFSGALGEWVPGPQSPWYCLPLGAKLRVLNLLRLPRDSPSPTAQGCSSRDRVLFLPFFFPISSLAAMGERSLSPLPPSLTCPKSWRQKGTQSLVRFLWDKSRKTPENGLLTTRGLWRGALSATHQAGFCYLLLGDYRPNCQFWEVIGLTFLPGPGTVFFCVSFLPPEMRFACVSPLGDSVYFFDLCGAFSLKS